MLIRKVEALKTRKTAEKPSCAAVGMKIVFGRRIFQVP